MARHAPLSRRLAPTGTHRTSHPAHVPAIAKIARITRESVATPAPARYAQGFATLRALLNAARGALAP